MARKAPQPGIRFRKLADKSEGERDVRYLARGVEPDEEGNALIDPSNVQRILYNPATPELEHEPWPFAGLAIEGEPPAKCSISTGKVAEGLHEGWAEAEGATNEDGSARRVFRASGPAENPWGSPPHVFNHYDAIVFKTVDGDVRYRVVGQPDKYNAGGTAGDHAGDPDADVRWFYELELEA